MKGAVGAVVLAVVTVLGSAETALSAPAGEGRSGFQALFGRRPVSPEPLNLLPGPAQPTAAPAEAPGVAQPVAPEQISPRKAEARKRATRRVALPARLPRSRPKQSFGESELTAGRLPVPTAIGPNAPAPEKVTAAPGLQNQRRKAVAAAPAPTVYPEILVPDFDALMLGELPKPEPLITGSVRPGEAPRGHPGDRRPETELLQVRPPAPSVQAGREPEAPPRPVPGFPPAGFPALSPDERDERAAAQRQAVLPAPEPTLLGEPYQLVRTLQALQDQIAGGSTTAFEAQRNLLAEIDRQFALAKPETWKDPRNAYALVTYVLSGGPPTALSRLLLSGAFPAGNEKLMRGALAYVEGRAAEAREQLAEIDARALPGSMGAQVALAQAALSVAADPAKALAQLDTARLLAPGTLVEEAALRREILVAGELGDIPKFQLLARQYLGRFRQSVYAGNFRQRFAAALSRMDFMNDEAQFPRLEELLVDLDPAARLEVYLTVARASAVQGRLTAARLASERALSLAETGNPDAARAMLYRGSALVVAADGLTAALEDLQTIDTTALTEADRALYNAVSITATSIQTAADVGAARPVGAAGDPATVEAEQPGEDATAPTLTRAQAALAAVDTLLEGAPQ